MLRKAFILLIVLILFPCIAHAKTETIFADHKYVMGDNDSKNDARRMCFLEAKRKVLEKAGTYIESHTQVKNYQLTKDEINSYAAALLKVETVKEEWKFVGENMAIFMTVKAEVDTGYIEKKLAKIKKDVSVQNKIKEQQAQIRELERKFVDIQKQLRTAGALKAVTLRKQRAEIDFKANDWRQQVLAMWDEEEEQAQELFEPQIEDAGNLMLTPLDVTGKFVDNAKTGQLFILTGRVRNDYSHNRRFIKITGKIFTKGKFAVKTESVFCGNFLSDIELSNLDLAAINKRLMNRYGDKKSNLTIKPGQMIPFMIVFSNLPNDLDEFSVEVAESKHFNPK